MLATKSIEAIFNASPTPCVVMLPDAPRFTVVSANKAFTRVTYFEEHDLINKGIFDVFPFDPEGSESTLKNRLEKVIATKSPVKGNLQQYKVPIAGTEKFEIKYWLPESFPVFNEKGDLDLIIHCVTDVEERVLIEEREKSTTAKLLKSQEHYRSLFDHHPDAVVEFDLEGNFVSANRSTVKMIECSMEEILEATFIPFIAPEDAERVAAHFQKATSGEIQNYNTGM
jgi:hypothetical protein